MGLEDAATLGYFLSKVTSSTQLPKATALYNSQRTSRTAKLLEETNIYKDALMNEALGNISEGNLDW